ncbi:MAG: PQQ-binding-like beta-propeller repeat protein [Cyclobacteriaceae bacterium]
MKHYALVILLAILFTGVNAQEFNPTGIEDIDQARKGVMQTPTNMENAVYRQSVLFSWFRHMINRGVDLKDLHELGYDLAHWGPTPPENYPKIDEAYAIMERLHETPVYITEIRGSKAPPVKKPHDWAFFGGSPLQSGLSKDPGPTTGEIAWKFPTGHSFYASASVEDGRVYITSPSMRTLMYCLDESTGEVIWRTKQDGLQMYSTARGASNVVILEKDVVMRAVSGSWEFEGDVKHVFYIDKKSGKIRRQVDANRVDYRRGTTTVTANEEFLVYPYGRLDLKAGPATAIMQNTVTVKRRNGQRWWSYHVGDLFGEIVMDDDLIFAGTDNGTLHALNLHGGNRIRWAFDAESPIRMTPAVHENIVIIATQAGELIAIDRESGKALWRNPLNKGEARAFQLFSNPVISQGKIFIGSATKELYCVDLKSGKLLWKNKTSDWVRSKPMVIANRVYYATLDGNVGALEFNDTGYKKLWTGQAGHHQIFADLSGTDKGILATSSDLYLYSLNPETGKVQWRRSLIESTFDENGERIMGDIVAGGGDFQSPPTVKDGTVYVGTPARFVIAMDAKTGNEIWRFETSGQVSGAPSVHNGRVYFGQQGGNNEMYCVDAKTGSPIWSSNVGWVWTTSTPDETQVYTGTVDGRIIALDIENGEEVWEHLTNGGVYPAPAVDDKRVYTGSWDGQYFAINKKTGKVEWAYSSFGGLPDSAAGILWRNMYICRTDGRLCGLDRDTGERYWAFEDPRNGLGKTVMNATPSCSGDKTFVSTSIDHDGAALGGTLYCISNKTGEKLWEYTGAGGWTGSSCTENTVIVGSSTESYVTCLDVEPNPDGSPKIIWRTKIGGILEETIPAIYGNMAYLLATDGYVYAFQ